MAGTTREWHEDLPAPVGVDSDDPTSSVTAAVEPNSIELAEALISEAARIVLRCGGVVAITADRVEYAPQEFACVGLIFKWDSYGGPARRLKREEPEEAEPEPEPAAAE